MNYLTICPQGYTRVYCHQQAQSNDHNSFGAGQDQPVVCAVCFNGHNFYGPDCTTNGKLITKIEEEEKKEKSTPKPKDGVGDSAHEPKEEAKTAADSAFLPGVRTFPIEENEPPTSNPDVEKSETDNTPFIWLGIGGLIACPFIIVIANGVYK